MKKHTYIRTGIAAFLTVALSVACVPGALALAQDQSAKATATKTGAETESTATYKKTEVVYASLAASGNPEAVYMINRFDVTSAGAIVDQGDYTSTQNLTNETDLAREGGVTVFTADEGTFFYQGDAAQTTLPWKVALTYKLDGKTVSADQLAGASGNLSIQVTTAKNDAVDPAFYNSFMMQMTFTLPGAAATNVQAEGATIASAGQDTTVAFTVLPGHDGNFTLKAQVKDFHMSGAQIAALPYSSVIEMPKTDSMVSGMTSLSDAMQQLTDGTASLASGVDELTRGAQSLSSGAAAFGQGLAQLDGSSGALVEASGQIKDALSGISAALSAVDTSQLDQLKQLPAALRTTADGLDTARGSLSAVQQGYAAAWGALDAAIANIAAGSVSDQEISNLRALASTGGTPEDVSAVDKLAQAYAAAQAVKSSYNYAAFDAANKTLLALSASDGALAQSSAGLRSLADLLDTAVGNGQLDQIAQLIGGMSQLSNQYGQFHSGLVQYTSGVSALAANYAALDSGVSSLAKGTGRVSGGASALSGGMGELNAVTITLPDTMREQIAQMTAEFDFPEFEPVSFMSPANKQVAAVQFVMTTAAIEQPEPEQTEQPQPEQTMWDRFLALFL